MLSTAALTFDSEHMTPLDDAALAAIVGGDGPLGEIFKKLVEIVVDCLTSSIDVIIEAAEEGYEDAR